MRRRKRKSLDRVVGGTGGGLVLAGIAGAAWIPLTATTATAEVGPRAALLPDVRRGLSSDEMASTRGGVTVTSVVPSSTTEASVDNPDVTINFTNQTFSTTSVNILVEADGWGKTSAGTVTGLSSPNYAGSFRSRQYWPWDAGRKIKVAASHPNDPEDWKYSYTSTHTLRIHDDIRLYGVMIFNGKWGSFEGTLPNAILRPVFDLLTDFSYSKTDNSPDAVFTQCTLADRRQQWRKWGGPEGVIETATLSASCIDFPECDWPAGCANTIGRATGDTLSLGLRVLSVQSIGGGSTCVAAADAFQRPLTYTDTAGVTKTVEFIVIESAKMDTEEKATDWFSHEVGHAVFRSVNGEHTCPDGTLCFTGTCTTCPTTTAECPDLASTNVMCPVPRGRTLTSSQCTTAKNVMPAFHDYN